MDSSLNETPKGAHPEVVDAEKLATGAWLFPEMDKINKMPAIKKCLIKQLVLGYRINDI